MVQTRLHRLKRNLVANRVEILKFTPEQWSHHAEGVHYVTFGGERPRGLDRVDMVLLAELNGDAVGYMTIREHDSKTIYIQLGGMLPEFRNTIYTYKAYTMALSLLKQQYTHIYTLIENINTKMLRLAMKAGFIISGVRLFKNQLLVEHTLTNLGE